MESVCPAHFPEPRELGSCGEYNGLNYGVWTRRVGPRRQELTSPHLLHASDPRLGWEAVGASGTASGLPQPMLNQCDGERESRTGRASMPLPPCLGPRPAGDAQGTKCQMLTAAGCCCPPLVRPAKGARAHT